MLHGKPSLSASEPDLLLATKYSSIKLMQMNLLGQGSFFWHISATQQHSP